MKTQFLWLTRFIVSASTECQATAEVWAELYRCPRVSKSFGVTPPLPTGPVHTSLTQSILWPPMGETQSLGGLTRSHLNLRRDGGNRFLMNIQQRRTQLFLGCLNFWSSVERKWWRLWLISWWKFASQWLHLIYVKDVFWPSLLFFYLSVIWDHISICSVFPGLFSFPGRQLLWSKRCKRGIDFGHTKQTYYGSIFSN